MNKHLKRFLLLLIVSITLFLSFAQAATKEDVIVAINATYQVSETEKFRLPQKYINKGEEYLNTHPLTSKQYSQILAAIDKAVEFAREVGHTNYKKYTKEQINRALSIIIEACRAANVDFEAELRKETNNKTNKNNSKLGSNKVITEVTPKVKDKSGEKITSSGDSGDIISGDYYETTYISGDYIDTNEDDLQNTHDDVLSQVTNEESSENIYFIINRNIVLVIMGIILVIIFNILLIRLIFKKNWNKIFKKIVIAMLVILIIALISVLCLILYYIEEIKMIYELYYLFK